MKEGSNVTAHIAYDDLREWPSAAERLGEVKHLKGATWQEDIGLGAEAHGAADDPTACRAATAV